MKVNKYTERSRMHPAKLNKYVYHQIYYHLVWSTKDREEIIIPQIKKAVYQKIYDEILNHNGRMVKIGGVTDHLHILIRCAPNHYIPEFVKQIKGSSSHFVNDQLQPDFHFKWQRGYGIFTVSKWDLPRIYNYIKNQRHHHQTGSIIPELERYSEYDDDYFE